MTRGVRGLHSSALGNASRRAMVLPHQDWRCLCRQPLDVFDSTLEHVIPRGKGGPDRLGNLLVTCYRCNKDKADREPTGCELIWLFVVNLRTGRGPIMVSELWRWE